MFSCSCTSHWTNKDGKRVSMNHDLRLPFAPFAGLVISVLPDEPPLTVNESMWDMDANEFSVCMNCHLEWEHSLFVMLADAVRESFPDATCYDDSQDIGTSWDGK